MPKQPYTIAVDFVVNADSEAEAIKILESLLPNPETTGENPHDVLDSWAIPASDPGGEYTDYTLERVPRPHILAL